MNEWRSLKPEVFEKRVVMLFESLGYAVTKPNELNLKGFYLINKNAGYASYLKNQTDCDLHFTLFHLNRTDCIEQIEIYDITRPEYLLNMEI